MTPRTPPGFPRRTAILGSTGTIGEKALAVVARHPDRFQVVSLAAGRSGARLAEQTAKTGARKAVLAQANAEAPPSLPAGVTFSTGAEAVTRLASDPEVDLVVNGIVGRAGLEASLAAVEAGKMLALANKESLVLAGELLMATARARGAQVLPVDSEHSGLFQCLEGRDPRSISRVVLTASGGPFRGRSRADLIGVTPAEALRHPVWPMGPRITVDSATLLNKGLEVLETHWLFDMPLDRIDVWIHPQSVVHALIEFLDGSLLAQLSAPDMILAVQYAMSYPERWEAGAPACRLPDWGRLSFEEPDHEVFPALRLAYRAGEKGGTAPVALNAADEVAVEAFLSGRLPFAEIVPLVTEVVERTVPRPADSLAAVSAADAEAREAARTLLAARRV